jgi:excisionase family DNA binding protein
MHASVYRLGVPTVLTLTQAAKLLGVAPATLRAQIHRARLKAVKLGRDWFVEEAEVERYRRDSQKRGS